MPKVSVVIPVYNIEEHLRECLNSVIRQSYSDLEIICVDDGSTDASLAILQEYAASDNRIQIISQPNGGPGVARNTGMQKATGEYIIFLDSDDWFEPNMISAMLHRAEATEADITICHSVEFDTSTDRENPSGWMLKEEYLPGEVFSPEDIPDYLFQFTYGWPWDKLYRTRFIGENNLVFPELRNSEDLVFVFSSLALAGCIAIEDKHLVHHRVNRLSSVSNSRRFAPHELTRSVKLLQRELTERGKYGLYQRSFKNWEMEFLIWNVANMGERKAQREYFDWLKTEGLNEAGFDRFPKEYYFNRTGYRKYLLVKHCPFPIFDAVLKSYKLGKSAIIKK